MSDSRLLLLGPPQFQHEDCPVTLRSAKAVALLAYLALTDAPQPRETLATLLWPDSLQKAAFKNLSNTLWALRKKFGDQFIVANGREVRLAGTVWTDVHDFEAVMQGLTGQDRPSIDALESVIQLYRGPLLEGLTRWDASEFETWLTIEQTRLNELYLSALDALVAAHRSECNWHAIIPRARQVLRHDAMRESMVQALMEAQVQLGERHAALRDYETLRAMLADELGAEPLVETEALHQAILRGALPPATVSIPLRRTDAAFIGRTLELAVLDEARKIASAGAAQVVLLTGELGIGKSRLWQAWSASLPTSQPNLQTCALDTARSLPFAPVTRLLRQSPQIQRLFKSPSPLSAIWLAELAHLLPELSRHTSLEIAPRITLPPDEARLRLFEALTHAMRTLEGQPLVLFIDDLHWADQATLDWLVYLVDQMRREPILLVTAYRPRDASARLAQQVANWQREGLAHQLPLPALTLEEAVLLLAQEQRRHSTAGNHAASRAVDDGTSAAQLYADSVGNPYFLLELSRAATGTTPKSLAALILTRLSRLPTSAYRLLQSAAVLESEADLAILQRMVGCDEEETINDLDLLVTENFLVESDNGYAFAHPLVRPTVQDELSTHRRRLLHHCAAEALQDVYAEDESALVVQLTTHYAQAGRPVQAARYAELAAERALALGGFDTASAFYRQAIALESTPARLVGLGQALVDQGVLAEVRQIWQEAAAAFVAQGDQAGAADVYGRIAGSYLISGEGEPVVQWSERMLLVAEQTSAPAIIAQAHIYLTSGSLLLARSLATVEHHLTQAVHIATDNDLPEIAAQGQLMLGNLLAEKGDLSQALQAHKVGMAMSQAAGNRHVEIYSHNSVAYHALLLNDLATAYKHINLGFALTEEYLLASPRQFLYSTRGEIALADGALDEAESWLNRGLVEAKHRGNRVQVANIHANLGLVARERGNLDRALMLLMDAYNGVADLGVIHLQSQIDLWLTQLYLDREELAVAEAALRRAEARLHGSERRCLQNWARSLRKRFIEATIADV